MMSMLVKSRLKCHRLSMRRWRGERPDISSKKSPSTWGPVFEEKIVEVPTVEVREVIKQVSKPEAHGLQVFKLLAVTLGIFCIDPTSFSLKLLSC